MDGPDGKFRARSDVVRCGNEGKTKNFKLALSHNSHYHFISAALRASATMSAATATQRTTVLSTYRILTRLVRCMPESKQAPALKELREGYRKNVAAPQDKIQDLINEAGKKIAYLRIITPKREWTGSAAEDRSDDGTTRWVYSSGGKSADGKGTVRRTGQVHSNWDGTNLDPCSVKRHNQQLKRAGFVNNLHAKGLF
jgi:hypothetical protein